jgi:hypothetical protein
MVTYLHSENFPHYVESFRVVCRCGEVYEVNIKDILKAERELLGGNFGKKEEEPKEDSVKIIKLKKRKKRKK